MPKSLTLGAKDLKALRAGLAGSSQQIDPAIDSLKTVKASPDLKPQEVEILMKGLEVMVKLQLRREFPILERVVDSLLTRLQTGEPLKPLTQIESRALVGLVEDLSDAENEALNLLRGTGLIRETDWKDVIEPHRATSNKVQRGEVNKAKWGAAFAANGISPAVAAIGLSMIIPGIGGMLGAVAIATGMGLAVSPKINEKIQISSRIEGRSMGMNVIDGRETVSEPVLLASRLIEGEAFRGNVAENLKTEIALADMLLAARQNANVGWGPYETDFLNMAGKYHAAMQALVEANDKAPMSDAELRRELFDVRAQLMAPADMAPLVKLVGTANVPTDDTTRLIVAHRQMATLFDLIGKQAASGAPESQGTAVAILHVLPMMDEEVQGSVTSVMRGPLEKLAKGQQLDAADKALIKDSAVELDRIADDTLARNGLDERGATKRAQEVVDTLLGSVLPAFGDETGDPRLRDVRVTKAGDDSYTVAGAFKSGVFGQEGSFSIEVGKNGVVDMDSFKLDVGGKRASSVAQAAAVQAFSMLNPPAPDKAPTKFLGIQVNDGKTPPPDAYVMGVTGGGKDNYVVDVAVGNKRTKVEVTPMGLVDWTSIKV